MAAPILTNVTVSARDTSGTVSAAYVSEPAVGSLLVAIVIGGGTFSPTNAGTSLADDATGGSNTWTLLTAQGIAGSLGYNDVSIWTAPCERTKAGLTVTLTPNYQLYGYLIIGEITGADPTATDTPAGYANSTTPSVDFAPTTDAETLLIAASQSDETGAEAYSLPGAPWSDVSTGANGSAYYSVVSSQRTSTGSDDLAWGAWATSNAWCACGVVFKASGGAPPAAPPPRSPGMLMGYW
jgi:hypothetical protein